MRIVIVTDSYPPEIRSASHLMYELASGLAEQGHAVNIITCWPKYNLDRKTLSKFAELTNENNIRVIRVKVPSHHNNSYIVRGLSHLIMPIIFRSKLKQYVDNHYDVMIVYSPPLTLGLLGILAKRSNKRFILNVQDLFPQNAIDLGILKNKFLKWLFKAIESYVYQKADQITVHSQGNLATITQNKPTLLAKCSVLHNWVEQPTPTDAHSIDFRKLYQLQNKFVIVFAGVMGPSQALMNVIYVAEEIIDFTDIVFLLVGDGSQRKKIQKYITDNNIPNVLIKDFIAKEQYNNLLAYCDVGLVSLSSQNHTPVVPGKLQGYMAVGLPVIAFLNKESDGHQIIAQANCGMSCCSDNVVEMTKTIIDIYHMRSLLKDIGLNGRRFANKYFSKRNAINKLTSMMLENEISQ